MSDRPGPIASVFLASAVDVSKGGPRSKENPKGWWPYTPTRGFYRGDATFERDLLAHADDCVARCKRFSCVAVEIRDTEGEQFDQPKNYLGSPMDLGAPMTVALARAFSDKFRSAGMKVGGTIRPTVPAVYEQQQWGRPFGQDLDPYAVLYMKVKWARENLNWNLFYVDSNVDRYKRVPGQAHDVPVPTPADVFVRLGAEFPDCHFIPEFSDDAYETLSCVTRYREHDFSKGPGPEGRYALAITGGDVKKPTDLARMTRSFRSGGVPIVPVWTDFPAGDGWVKAWKKAKN
jgi:hypothetical protein